MAAKTEASKAATLMGKRSYAARLERFGLERLQQIARKNGKLGGRPVGSGKKRTNATKKGTSDGSIQAAKEQVLVVQVHLERISDPREYEADESAHRRADGGCPPDTIR